MANVVHRHAKAIRVTAKQRALAKLSLIFAGQTRHCRMKIDGMKQPGRFLLFVILPVLLPLLSQADTGPFRFAWLSDTFVGSPTGAADLRAAVRDINSLAGFNFVIISGNVTQSGSHDEFILAKSILDGLRQPCHVIPGNRDCQWSESGATEFGRIWGSDRFVFDAGGFCFIGMPQGPLMKRGDGHFAPQDVRWLDATLAGLPKDQPVIFVTHHPLDEGIDNWFAVLDELKKFNTQAVLAGRGHGNEKMNFEGVPAALGWSNLRNLPKPGGYTLVEAGNGVLTIAERDPGRGTQPPRDTVPLQKHDYSALTNHWPRPDFSVNSKYPNVCERWRFDARWTIAFLPGGRGRPGLRGRWRGKNAGAVLEERRAGMGIHRRRPDLFDAGGGRAPGRLRLGRWQHLRSQGVQRQKAVAVCHRKTDRGFALHCK